MTDLIKRIDDAIAFFTNEYNDAPLLLPSDIRETLIDCRTTIEALKKPRWNTRPASGEWVPQYDVNVRDIHHAIDILMEHIEQADGNTAILICEINDELHDNKLLQIQLRAVSDTALFVPAPPNPDDEGGEG